MSLYRTACCFDAVNSLCLLFHRYAITVWYFDKEEREKAKQEEDIVRQKEEEVRSGKRNSHFLGEIGQNWGFVMDFCRLFH